MIFQLFWNTIQTPDLLHDTDFTIVVWSNSKDSSAPICAPQRTLFFF